MKQEILASIIAGVINAILGLALTSFAFVFLTIIKAFALGFIITLVAIYLAKLLGGRR